MDTITDYEDMLIRLAAAGRRARDAKLAVHALADKIKYSRLETHLHEAMRIVRLHYYDFADAVAVQIDRCPGCGAVQLGGG